MEHILPKVREVAGRISSAEERSRKLAGLLRNPDFRFSFPVERMQPDGIRIAAVDGGIVQRSVHGFDFILARAVGVCFSYEHGKVASAEYHPEKMPPPEFFALESLADNEWAQSASMIRQKLEIANAIECAEKFRPSLLLLDGSVVPHYTERPAKGSKAKESYDEMISLYRRLFERCMSSDVMLAGVIEDSRGTKFCDIAKEKVASAESRRDLECSRDTSLLYWMLKEGERTLAFRYSEKAEEHPAIKDLQDVGADVFSFYLKTAKFDRPVRIDFLGGEKLADKIAPLVLSISSHHSGYGFPSVLIEADQAAKLSDGDMESVYEQIVAYTGPLPGVLKLRRDSRPF
jgi:hypothetical protein